jgi:hypothetical protein
MKYGFYSKQDPNREIIIQGIYQSMAQAEREFSIKKNLDIDTFLSLYEVVQLQQTIYGK